MIEKVGADEFDLVCDLCEDSADELFETFYEAVDYKKDNGWKSEKQRGSWRDVCPNCQGEK